MTTKIEWTDETWSPVTGCTKVSPGCDNCYAEAMTRRFEERWGDFGTVRLHPRRLDQPLRWRKPRRVFVCSMGDLFHKDVPTDFIVEVFRMAFHTPHILQVLTKRSSRMKRLAIGPFPDNLWLGVSVEDRKRLVRVDHLRQTPAAVRFLSCEPLLGDLGELDLTGIHWVIVGGESGPRARPCHPAWARNIKDQCQAAGVPFFLKQNGVWAMTAGLRSQPRKSDVFVLSGNGSLGNYMHRVGKKCAGAELDGREWKEFPS